MERYYSKTPKPPSCSTNPGISVVKALPQHQKIPRSVRAQIPKTKGTIGFDTKEIFKNFDGHISLSVDMLMHESRVTFGLIEHYLCLSAHFVDENWELRKQVLYFRSMENTDHLLPEDGEDWGIFRSLKNWGIENKISSLTMTNDGVYNELVEFVKKNIHEKKELQLNGRLFRVYCCGELISSMVENAFFKIQDIIDKVSLLYSFGRSLPLWYLTSSKLKEALQLWSEGEFASVDETFYEVPSAEEWKKVAGVCKVVDTIYNVSNALFKTEDVTANVYLYHLHELREVLTQMSTDSDSFITTIVKDMLEKFDKYWDDMFLLLAIAAVLDPRYKMKYVETVCSKVKGSEGNSQVAAVLEAIHKLFDNYVSCFPEKDNFMRDSLREQELIQSNDGPTRKLDLHCYLEEAVSPLSQDFTVLTWWRTTGAKYPTLSRMARDFLAVPFSIATSYKAFYTEPRPAIEDLIGLDSDSINAVLYTRSWYSGN